MSDVFFDELGIPTPDMNLGVGSGSHGAQTARMLIGAERALVDKRPDMVITFGDTNSTIAGALAATKLCTPTAHVEAGLRSFNRAMPEEINRIVADHVSDLLLAPTPTAMKNLDSEGLGDKSRYTGDVMRDSVLQHRVVAAERSTVLARFGLTPGSFGLITVHRAENTDDPRRLNELLTAFNRVASDGLELIFPVHPRTAKAITSNDVNWEAHPRLRLVEPVGYLDILRLTDAAKVVMTDSGGLQKEALFLDTPCVTLRDETEWVETVEIGGNVVCGTDPDKITTAVANWNAQLEAGNADFREASDRIFGRGDSAAQILGAVLEFLN